MNEFAVGNCWPDLTFLLDIDIEAARARMLRRVRPAGGMDRMEQEPVQFYQDVCVAYRQLAEREPDRIQVIDGRSSATEIEQQIWRAILTRFGQLADLIGARDLSSHL
jgi:dTMP kinase